MKITKQVTSCFIVGLLAIVSAIEGTVQVEKKITLTFNLKKRDHNSATRNVLLDGFCLNYHLRVYH